MGKSLSRMALVLAVLLLLGGLAAGCGGGGDKPQDANQGQTSTELSETLQVNGSTTVAPIAQAWAEAFHEKNPKVEVVVSGTGSGDGIAALINGTTDIAMASREMKDKEKEQIKNGTPVEYIVGYDALAVIVHPGNPVQSLSMEQVKDIFTGRIKNWKEVGGPDKAIIIYTRDTSSGTYEFFKEHVLNKEEFADNAKKVASTAAMTKSVAQDETSIGYVGLAFVDSTVKALAVSNEGGNPVAPSVETAKSKEYPIVRGLNMYTINEAQGLAKAFLDFGLSAEGQAMVQEVGYIPVK
ncbi:MAG: phosphate ABC transporter substrate-binding protein [Bacillota bacterium]|uniref:phosphate ABC transporter substrate-binding protein n=1 Tax=unclassified Candidatus Desulforudis TaxID=2635950 RepID=UPI003BC30121